MWIFQIFLTIGTCNSLCTIVSSLKHGQLFLVRSGNFRPECVSDLVFQNQETGQQFCLMAYGAFDETVCTAPLGPKLQCAGSACTCGQENKPDEVLGVDEVGVVGGERVGENQYPWYALVFVMETSKTGVTSRALQCGGSLITDNMVLSAAHCVSGNETASDLFIALGLHNVSGFSNWSQQELKKHVFRNVKEIITHPQHELATLLFDFALFILKSPVKMSKIVSPVCLPHPDEFDIIERKKNILIGFGLSRMWFQYYNELRGGVLEIAQLIPLEIVQNETALIDKLEEPNFQESIVHGFFKTFQELFPGIDACIDNYEFVCKIDDVLIDEIIKNIVQQIPDPGRERDEEYVKYFLEFTRSNILVKYTYVSSIWKEMSEAPLEEKIGFIYFLLFHTSEASKKRIAKSVKFVNQWIFIGIIKGMDLLINKGLKIDPILKKAVGEFFPMSEADKRVLPSKMLIQRYNKEDGFACSGDSGGPIVVENSGRFVLVAVVSSGPNVKPLSSWPPFCMCHCEGEPETHARVSAAIP